LWVRIPHCQSLCSIFSNRLFIYICPTYKLQACGLKHLENERIVRHQNVLETIRAIGKVIENGHIYEELSDRWKIKYKDATVIISKELKNKKAIAIITGYKKNKKP